MTDNGVDPETTPFLGEHVGHWGYKPGYVDEMIVKYVLGELSEAEWQAMLARIKAFEEVIRRD